LTHKQFEKLRDYLFGFGDREAAAYLIAGFFKDASGTHFTVKKMIFPEPSDYLQQLTIHLEISPQFVNRVIANAEADNLTAIICHSHPKSNALDYSRSDDYGETETAKILYDCLGAKPMASLLFGAKTIIGRFRFKPLDKPTPIDEIRLIDRHIDYLPIKSDNVKQSKVNYSLYSRQILAFGRQFQAKLDRLTVGVIGLGGTGSAVTEQLARLGVNKLILVDKDSFELSNLTRLYGSTFADSLNNPLKTSIANRSISSINPKVKVECYGDVIDQKVLSRLKGCDIIFSCTDRHSPRSVLNELCYQCYIPVIDVGVGLDAKNDRLQGGTIRATIIAPSLPCLFCTNTIRSDIIATEFLSIEEQKARKKEGYIRGLSIEKTPSMISFTTIAASIGIHLFLDILCNFMQNESYNYLLDIETLSTHRLSSAVAPGCICDKRIGAGDTIPFSAP
jgi:molybdopterin-synthase adenylyltransferase